MVAQPPPDIDHTHPVVDLIERVNGDSGEEDESNQPGRNQDAEENCAGRKARQ
jgi:hypothetical protein